MLLNVCFFITAFCIIEGCLITNCPKGGKRSSISPLQQLRKKPIMRSESECRRCGPSFEGICVSKAICCGPQIGCVIGDPAVLGQCNNHQQSTNIPRLARPCSIGYCMSDGVCCSTGGCKFDMSCEMDLSTNMCALLDQAQV